MNSRMQAFVTPKVGVVPVAAPEAQAAVGTIGWTSVEVQEEVSLPSRHRAELHCWAQPPPWLLKFHFRRPLCVQVR